MELHYASFPFLTSLLLCCGLGLLTILLIPGTHTRAIKVVSAVFSGATILIAIYLYTAYDRGMGGYQFVERLDWIPRLGVSYFNGVDGFGLPMLLLSGIVFFTAVLTMWDLELRVKEFFALIFLLVSGVFGLFMSLDLFFIFVWFDVSLFPMYLLIAIWGSTRKEFGAMKLTLYLLAGSALILPAIIYLVVVSGLGTFDLTTLMKADLFTPFQQRLAFLMLYIGFGILAGVFPLSYLVPGGPCGRPHGGLHDPCRCPDEDRRIRRASGGIFLCPQGWAYWAQLMGVLATCGIVYGVFVGLSQTDLKYVIGYSSVSHMGIVGLGLSTMTVDGLNGAVYQMFAHGIMTALFFSSVGYIYDKTHTKAIADLGGLSRIMPRASGFFIIAALTGIGVPCLASFWGELVVFTACVKVYPVRGALAIGALVVGALFMLRVVQKVCYGPPVERFAHLPDVPASRAVPRVILVSVIVLFGLFSGTAVRYDPYSHEDALGWID